MLIFLRRCRSSFSKGFTLTELMVVITIMTILTGVFLFQQRQFDSTTLLRSLAYSVALSIREAQTYGISVRSFGGGFPAYGVYFDKSSGSNDKYFLFADVNSNGQYDVAGNELVDVYTFQGNYTISDICGTEGANPEVCGITWMTITFRRPNPDACIATSDPGMNDVCGASPPSPYAQGRVQIVGPGGTTRSVIVTPSGQISVGAPEI